MLAHAQTLSNCGLVWCLHQSQISPSEHATRVSIARGIFLSKLLRTVLWTWQVLLAPLIALNLQQAVGTSGCVL